jgi:hypothetical protein
MNFSERYIYDHLNVREAGVLEFAGPCTGKECGTCMHFNEKISELTQSSETKKPTASQRAKAKKLRALKKKHRSARTASSSVECLWCGGFHPRTAEKWTSENDRKVGLPRPFLYDQTGEFKRTPVPYSHTVDSSDKQPYDYYSPVGEIPEHKCMWCGEKFEQNEQTERWKGGSSGTGSDSQLFPMHPKCMRQLKIFCPHVRMQSDEAFESGPYSELRKNAEEETGLS